MATKQWRMRVIALGSDETLRDVGVEADNWMTALRVGRTTIGENGGVPTGSSCEVSAGGAVTILDPVGRRRFVLELGSPPTPVSTTPVSTTPVPVATSTAAAYTPPSPAAAPQKRRALAQTMAYIPNMAAGRVGGGATSVQQPIASSAVPVSTPAAIPASTPASVPAPAKPASIPAPVSAPPPPMAASVATRPVSTPPAPAAKSSPAPAAKSSPAPAVSNTPKPQDETSPADATAGTFQGTSWRLLSQRDEDPSAGSPLTYRERSYVVPIGTSMDAAEALARERDGVLMDSLSHIARGRFLNIAIFDHSWTERPERPPMLTLAHKDWQGDAVIERTVPPSNKHRPSTGEHDRRLAIAFEACQDLLFLGSPFEAIEFVQRLLEDLIPCAAITGALYDINANVHRVVIATGPGGDARKGAEIPHQQGLIAQSVGHGPPVIASGTDARFSAEHDGRPGLDVQSALYVAVAHQGRHLAAIQLINRARGPFNEGDSDLTHYVAAQLGEFLYKARTRANQ